MENITKIEKEWARYKYLVLEHSPEIYKKIRELLKNKKAYPIVEFNNLVDEALSKEITSGHAINAAQHIWGYFSKEESREIKEKVMSEMEKIEKGNSSTALKKILWELTNKNKQEYLLQSLYFKDVMKKNF